MSDALPRHRHRHVLVSVHGIDGLDCVELDRAGALRVLLHNHMQASYPLSTRAGPGLPPHLHLDLSGLGAVELDHAAVRAPGWRVTEWRDSTLSLAPLGEHGWFLDETVLAVDLGDVTVTGDAGPGSVTVTMERFAPEVDGESCVSVMRLPNGRANADAVAVEWVDGARLLRTPSRAAPRANTLRLRVASAQAGEELYLSTATAGAGRYRAIASAGRVEDAQAQATDPWRAERTASAGMPVYRIWYAGSVYACSESGSAGDGSAGAEVELGNVVSDQDEGDAQVVVYSSQGYTVSTLAVEEGSVTIDSFTADQSVIDDITQPAPVHLSWSVDNATTVTLSGVGVVQPQVTGYQVFVEQTTTFVLTAFDASLADIASAQVTVTVNPSLSSRMVPAGTILLWSGSTATIPSGWALCDGSNGTPDLRDRFVMGAGGNEAPGASGAADKHTHAIPQLQQSFTSSYGGAHTHGMPSNWYHRSLSSGGKTGIDTDGTFSTSTQTQSAGDHSHAVAVSFPSFDSGVNGTDVLPPWYALAFVMKLPTST